jgi:4-carboxymuconolactone decarboxylase
MVSYYDDGDLERFSEVGETRPELLQKFMDWYGAATGDGALSVREKALIALAVAHTVQCPYCIDAWTTRSLECGADLAQMTEAVHVAAAIKAGSCLIHGVQMRSRHDSQSM